MTYYENIKNMTFDEMLNFILHHVNSECHGEYDSDCEEEGYANCTDCISRLLNLEVNKVEI